MTGKRGAVSEREGEMCTRGTTGKRVERCLSKYVCVTACVRKREKIDHHLDVSQCACAELVGVGGEPRKARAVEVRGEGAEGEYEAVEAQVELLAPNEERPLDVSLHHVQLDVVLLPALRALLPLYHLRYLVDQEDPLSLRELGNGVFSAAVLGVLCSRPVLPPSPSLSLPAMNLHSPLICPAVSPPFPAPLPAFSSSVLPPPLNTCLCHSICWDATLVQAGPAPVLGQRALRSRRLPSA